MANCPNINLKEWKDLVESVGEVEAYAAFIKNGYDIPAVDEDGNYTINEAPIEDVLLNDIDKEADNLKRITKTKNDILASLKTKYNIYEGSMKDVQIKQLKKMINDLEKANIVESLIIYSRNVDRQITSLSNRIGSKTRSLKTLKQLDDFAGTFYLIHDVVKLIEGNPDISQAVKDRIGKVAGKVSSFEKKYTQHSKDILVDEMANQSTIARGKAKIKYAREYEENHPRSSSSLTKDEYNKAKKAYVKKMLIDNKDKILNDEKRVLREIMNTAPKDVSTFTRLMIDPRGINDHMIQLAVKQLDAADFKAKEAFIESRREVVDKWQEFVKKKKGLGITDQKKIYDGIIEKIDGKETNYYVREYYSTYYKALNESIKAQQEAKLPSQIKKISDEFEKNFPKAKFRNPQYTALKSDSEKQGLYDYLIKYNIESDNMVPAVSRLGYRLPSVTKTLAETKTDVGTKAVVGRVVRDTFNVQKDDHQFGELEESRDGLVVATDEKGEALRRVAVPFRIPLDVEDQSFDLIGMALSNRYVSLNYKEKNDVRVQLEIMEDIVKDRNHVKHKSGAKLLRKIGVTEDETGELEGRGVESNSYKLLSDILEDRLYGRHNVKAGKVGMFDIDKISSLAIKFSANNMLIANYMGGTANILAGKAMNFFEGTRRKHYSRKDLRTAEKKYFGDFKAWADDVGKPGAPTSKTNMLIEKFIDTSMDFSGFSNNMSKDTKFKQLFNTGTLHGINNMAEHYIQSTLVYAMLNNTKVVNKEGEFVDRDGNVTTDRNKAMTMDQAYDNVDGKLTWKNKDLSIEGHDNFDGDVEFAISRKLKDVVSDLQGNYDEKNRAQLQRHWYGKLGFFLRKWMVRGVQRRWRGIESYKNKIEDGFYSEASEEFKEGTYTSAWRLLTNIWKEGKMIQAHIYGQEWNKMTDIEKANIRAAAWEVSIMMASLTASAFLAELAAGADDEDDEERLYSLAYLTRRQYGELMFFLPVDPMELIRVAENPSATLSTVGIMTKTFKQMLEDVSNGEMEVYESGRHRGEYKTQQLLNKTFNPIYKNLLDADSKKKYDYLVDPPR